MGFTEQNTRDERFKRIGRDLFISGAVTSHGGNLSEREGQTIHISRRGSMLGLMSDGDVVSTGIDPGDRDASCSRELVVHRAIYQACDAGAIVHAHTLNTIFRSLVDDRIEPVDSEAKYIFGGSVPVIRTQKTVGSEEGARLLAELFASGDTVIAVMASHGPFAIGATLEEAFYRVSALEASCTLLNLFDSTGLKMRGVGE